jgi:26S proteasome regulatory subunit N2
MEAVLDTGFSLLYRDQVLHKLLPLFLSPTTESKSPHVRALTRLLVTLSNASLTVPLFTLLVRHEKLLAYQFDLVEGGKQYFLENDLFLRDILEWLGMASNWSKFSATAAIGVIHNGER